MNKVGLEELKKYLGDGITIRKYYKVSYNYDNSLKGLLVELDGTMLNLFISLNEYSYFNHGKAHTVLKLNHPFGKVFLTVEDCFLELFTPIVEGMVI